MPFGVLQDCFGTKVPVIVASNVRGTTFKGAEPRMTAVLRSFAPHAVGPGPWLVISWLHVHPYVGRSAAAHAGRPLHPACA